MSMPVAKGFTDPDEVREFPHGHVDLVDVGTATVGRAGFEPGWRWSRDVKPIAGTDSCQAAHTGYVLAGRMHVVMDDGREDCVMLDFTGLTDFARR